jgi:hypothetical protein
LNGVTSPHNLRADRGRDPGVGDGDRLGGRATLIYRPEIDRRLKHCQPANRDDRTIWNNYRTIRRQHRTVWCRLGVDRTLATSAASGASENADQPQASNLEQPIKSSRTRHGIASVNNPSVVLQSVRVAAAVTVLRQLGGESRKKTLPRRILSVFDFVLDGSVGADSTVLRENA